MKSSSPIVFVTDFGVHSPYLGLMKSAIYKVHQQAAVIDLIADCPAFSPLVSSYLLKAFIRDFPAGSVFLCVVDPGVGTQSRAPVVVWANNCVFVGPDNGVFDVVIDSDPCATISKIEWRPDYLSASFHGRDLFAPVAAHINRGSLDGGWLGESLPVSRDVSPDLYEVVYIDHYGNAITGIRYQQARQFSVLRIKGLDLIKAEVFGSVAAGEGFWYENSLGLVEISVNQGSAENKFSITVGDTIEFIS